MVIEFDVTHNEIEAGERASDNSCPIALGLKCALDKLGVGYRDVAVGEMDDAGNAFTSIDLGYGFMQAELPLDAHNFMASFDDQGPKAVQPFHVKLDFKRVVKGPAVHLATVHDEFMEIVRSIEASSTQSL